MSIPNAQCHTHGEDPTEDHGPNRRNPRKEEWGCPSTHPPLPSLAETYSYFDVILLLK